MKRIRTANRAIDLFGAGKDGFAAAVAGVSNATYLDAYSFNHYQEALVRTRELAGIAVPADNDFSWFPASVTALIEARVGDYAIDTGAVNSFVMALNPTVTTNASVTSGKFRVAHTNTNACTLDVGFGPTPLKRDDGTPLQAADLPAGTLVGWTYDRSANIFLIESLVAGQTLTATQFQSAAAITAIAGGTADALTAAFVPVILAAANQTILVRAGFANVSTVPTINPGPAALTIVKGNNLPLAAGDIAGAGHWLEITLDATLGKAVLQNPATGVTGGSGAYTTQSTVTVGTTFSSANIGSQIEINATAATAHNLPAANTFPNGRAISFSNINTGIATFARNGADVITGGNLSAAVAIALNRGETVTLISNGAGAWYVASSNVTFFGPPLIWSDLSGSRSLGTTYTNSTGREIRVNVNCVASAGGTVTVSATVNGVNIAQNQAQNNSSFTIAYFSFAVPAGATYSLSNPGSIASMIWTEER